VDIHWIKENEVSTTCVSRWDKGLERKRPRLYDLR